MESTLQIDTVDFRQRVDKLIEVLHVHIDNHSQLAEILEEKKSALVKMKYEDLKNLMEREKIAIGRVGDIERERIELTDELAVFLGRDEGSTIRIVELVMIVGEDHRDELLEIRDEIRNVADRIDRVNKLNGSLVMQSLEDIHLFIAMLSGTDLDAKTYGEHGQSDDGPSSLLFDHTA